MKPNSKQAYAVSHFKPIASTLTTLPRCLRVSSGVSNCAALGEENMAGGRELFFEQMRSAPFAAHKFVETIHRRYDPRNDVDVHYAKLPDLRLRVFWENTQGKADEQNFTKFAWQKQKEVFYCETYLSPEELHELGFEGARQHKNGPLLAQLRIGSDYWDECESQNAFFRTLDLSCLRMTQSR